MYVTRDNPVLTNEAVLLRSDAEGIDEKSERTEEAWSYHRFEFKIAQSGHNLARGTDTETTLAVWPSELGKVEPPEGQTAFLDFSIPGSRIGYSDLTFTVTKNRTVLGPPGTPPPGDTEITHEAADTCRHQGSAASRHHLGADPGRAVCGGLPWRPVPAHHRQAE